MCLSDARSASDSATRANELSLSMNSTFDDESSRMYRTEPGESVVYIGTSMIPATWQPASAIVQSGELGARIAALSPLRSPSSYKPSAIFSARSTSSVVAMHCHDPPLL